MNPVAEKIGAQLFPRKIRKFLTFRLMTIFVALLEAWNLVFSVVNKSGRTPEPDPLTHSPALLALHNTILIVGFWLIYRTKGRKEYCWVRVVFYGMLLGGLAGEILLFVRRFVT
jgi:hypothetical protein